MNVGVFLDYLFINTGQAALLIFPGKKLQQFAWK